jgi:hypothetical protein
VIEKLNIKKAVLIPNASLKEVSVVWSPVNGHPILGFLASSEDE